MKAVLNGPQGRTVLESTVLTIGSSPDNSLVIDTIKVSAHHAEIRPEEQGFSIVDLGSIHGTYVNGERLDFNTPRMLSRGNSVTIGDMVFTYDIEDVQQNDATLPANLDLVGSSATPASGVESPLSHSAYGARVTEISSEDQYPKESDPQYTFPQQYVPPGEQQPYYPGTIPPGSIGPVPGYIPIAPVRRWNRRFIWIGLGVLVVIVLAVVGYIYFIRSTPEKTLDTYCNALLGQDYLTAYNQLSVSLQRNETESGFAQMLEAQGKITSCSRGSASISGATALVNLFFASSSGQNSNSPVTLIQDSGNTWRISVPFPPVITLTTYCHALKNKDYQIAYDQLSNSLRSQVSESAYETNESQGDRSVGGISNCTVSNMNEGDSSATGTITFLAGNGQTGVDHYTLTNDSGIWKISGVQ